MTGQVAKRERSLEMGARTRGTKGDKTILCNTKLMIQLGAPHPLRTSRVT